MNAPSASRAAFTMLEMLLALAIFAILLGMVITAMPRWQQTARVKQAAQLTKTGLEFARDRANAMNNLTHFTFETSTSAPPSAYFYVEDFSHSGILLNTPLPRGVFFATNAIITFAPGSRTTDSTGSVDIVLNSRETPLTSTIRISQASATVRIMR
jgi:prepilin-type N-terminal cleavage/methylation domain-containing protein